MLKAETEAGAVTSSIRYDPVESLTPSTIAIILNEKSHTALLATCNAIAA